MTEGISMPAPSIPALLEPIQKRAGAESGCSSDPCGSKVCKAQRDRARLLAAVKAVTEMHCETKRDFITAIDCIREECDCENECPTEELPVCRHCWNQLEQIDPYFGEEHHVSEVMWPCPTVSAVEAALRGGA